MSIAISDQELFRRLHAAEMDDGELESIFSNHFSSATSPHPNRVIFPNTDSEERAAITLTFKQGRLDAISAGPALSDADLAALEGAIELELSPAEPATGTSVLFANIPVEGAFRYRDLFQIIPVPADAPRPDFLIADHPFLLQFKFRGGHSNLVRASRQERQRQRLQLLLATLLEGQVRGRGLYSKHHWVALPPSEGAQSDSRYCQEIYTSESVAKLMGSASFCDVDRFPGLSAIDPVEYYTRIGIRAGQTLAVPANLTELLDRFDLASYDDQERFVRASFWFNHAQSVFTSSTSACFTALISAIESLMPHQDSVAACPTCKRPIGKGATQRLREFLDDYVPAEPKFQASRAALYWQFRSQLSHGGQLSHSDRGSFVWGLGGAPQEERNLISEVWLS